MNVKINLSPLKLDLYTISQTEVDRVLSKCYSRKCTDCELIDEAAMDRLIPPYIVEINIRHVVDRRMKGLSGVVKEYIEKIVPKRTEEFKTRLADVVEDAVMHRMAGTRSPLMHNENSMIPLPPNDDLVRFDEYTISDVIGAIANKMRVETSMDDFHQELRRLTMFTAMGCYGSGLVSLCPSRIESSAKALNVNENVLLEVVWIHEEMHSLMNSNVDGRMSEHIVQSMTAAALDKLNMHVHLDAMVKLACNQPDAYALFAMDPNVELLDSGTMLKNITTRKLMSPSPTGSTPIRKRQPPGSLKSMRYKCKVIPVRYLYEAAIRLAECMIKEDRAKFIKNVLPLKNERAFFTSTPASFNPTHQISGEQWFFQGSQTSLITNIMEQMIWAFGDNPSDLTLVYKV